jgi:hypothetical protein
LVIEAMRDWLARFLVILQLRQPAESQGVPGRHRVFAADKSSLNQDEGPVPSFRLHGMRTPLAAIAGANLATLASQLQS